MRQPNLLERLLFFSTILFLPTQLGKHFWPDFAFVYSLKIDYLSPTIYFWDLVLILLLLAWLWKRPGINTKALAIALFFILTQAFSLIFAENIGAGLFRLEQLVFSAAFGVYLASKELKEISKGIFWGLGIGVVVEGIVAVLQFSLGESLGLWILGERSFSLSTPTIATFNFYGQVFLRPYGTFSHPNVLAGFMVLAVPVILLFKERSKRVSFMVVFLGVVGTLLTFSRTGILVMFMEGLWLFRRKIIFVLVLLLLTLPILFVRFESAFNFDSLSILRREELAEISLNQFISRPFLGVGLNNFINEVASSSLVSGPNRFLQPVHNIFLLTLAESGLLGLSGILGILAVGFIRAFKFNKGLVLAFSGMLFLGLFDHYFLTLPQGQRIFFLIWGLAMLEWKDANN